MRGRKRVWMHAHKMERLLLPESRVQLGIKRKQDSFEDSMLPLRNGIVRPNQEETVFDIELRAAVHRALRSLEDQEWRNVLALEVILRRFGFATGNEQTLQDVADSLGYSVDYVRRMQDYALRMLRHPSRSRALRAFMEEE